MGGIDLVSRPAMSEQVRPPVNLSGREIAMQTRRIGAGFAFDRNFGYAGGDRGRSSGESRSKSAQHGDTITKPNGPSAFVDAGSKHGPELGGGLP